MFAVYPIAFALALVFMHWDLVTAPTFAGLDNVRLLAHDGRFWRAVANTFVFLSIHVPLQIVTALALALALNRKLALLGFWRASFFLPVVISGAVVAILWSNLYATDVGLINRLLVRIGLHPVPWLTDPATAMPAIAVMVTWKNVGFYVIIYLAGLAVHPAELPGSDRDRRRDRVAALSISHAAVAPAADAPRRHALDDQRLSALHRAVRDDRRRSAQAHVLGRAVPLHERVCVSEDGIRCDDRRCAGADHRRGRLHSAQDHRQHRGAMRTLGRIALYLGLTVAALTFIYPFLWMASATFKPPIEIGSLSLIPEHFTFDNYRTMWARAPFGRALLNSAFVATTITLAVLVFGSITAYAMARLNFRGRPVLNAATMAVLLVPGQLTLIPLYTLIVQLGWIDTYAALIIPYLFNATAILMMRQFFLQIPQSLMDAARMDGMGELRILFTIFWPLSKPVLSIVAIFTFMGSWNEVLWPLLVVRDQHLMTLPQLLTVFALGGGAGSVGVSLASAMVLVIPVVVAYVFLQRNFIESMAGAGIKG